MRVTTLLAALLLGGCSGPAVSSRGPSPAPWPTEGVPSALLAHTEAQPESVSFLQLIASPSTFQEKRVRLIGFAHVEFEGQALYFHREDFENGISKNAIWLDVDLRRPEFAALNDRYIIVEGVFRGGPRGHFGMFSGALTEISRYDPWPTRAQVELQAKEQH